VERVDHFKYLGSIFEEGGGLERELNQRLRAAGGAYKQLRKVLRSGSLDLPTKMQVYNAVVVPTLLYGAAESWTLTQAQEQRLNSFHTRSLRRILGVSVMEISNRRLFARTGSRPVSEMLAEHRLRWLGHLARRGPERLVKKLLFAQGVPGGRPAPGGPRLSLADMFMHAVREYGLERVWWETSQDRARWKNLTGTR
jgi:hypothetical protein